MNNTFRRALVLGSIFLSGVFSHTVQAASFGTYMVDTGRTTYTGSVTQYASLADAQAQTNATSGPNVLPNRVSTFGGQPIATELVVPYRDLSLLLTHDMPSQVVGTYQNATYLYTNWYLPPNHTPDNTSVGFLQYYNDPANGQGTVDFDTVNEGYFASRVGSVYTEMNVHVAGANAQWGNTMRMWQAPSAAAGGGIFRTWDLNVTFSGLNGLLDPSTQLIHATNQPTSAVGTLTGVFESVQNNPGNFYRFDYTISTDYNWFYTDPLNTAPKPASEFYAFAVPEPSAFCLAAFGGILILKRRHRTATK